MGCSSGGVSWEMSMRGGWKLIDTGLDDDRSFRDCNGVGESLGEGVIFEGTAEIGISWGGTGGPGLREFEEGGRGGAPKADMKERTAMRTQCQLTTFLSRENGFGDSTTTYHANVPSLQLRVLPTRGWGRERESNTKSANGCWDATPTEISDARALAGSWRKTIIKYYWRVESMFALPANQGCRCWAVTLG
jgi:hypothetical protein